MSRQIRQAKVLSTQQITPHLQRIIIGSDEFKEFSDISMPSYIGNYVKVLLPKKGQSSLNLDPKTAVMRSYTIRDVDSETGALTLDFVINMHQGPATDWAQETQKGDSLAIAGPGPKKMDDFSQSHYLLLGDLTSVNAIKGYLQQLPSAAKIDAFIHVPSKQDIIDLETTRPVNWVITNTPNQAMEMALSNLSITTSLPTIFMALEAGLVSQLKKMFDQKYAIPRYNIVASGYWKKGVNSERYKEQRQQQKNQNS